MSALSDSALAHLARVADLPDVPGGRYRVLSEIGRGGMGTVYLARDVELDREVAIKVVSDGTSERLRREARVLAQLEHPGIVPVHDVGTLADGRAFYVMKHVAGRRLDAYARDGATASEKLRVFGRICEAVAAAHEKGVVHRDLKPANVHVGPFGEVLVLDWGLARHAREPESSPGAVAGTLGYLAPEYVKGAAPEPGPRADVYALGCVLAYLWTLEHPDPESGRLPVLPAATPRPLASIARKATEADPARRYGDAGELAADVARLQAAERVSAHREGAFERLARLSSKHRVAILLVAGYLALRLVLLALRKT